LSRQVMLQLVLSGVFGDLGSVGAIATNSVSALSNAQFSQKQEKQADQLGLRLLAEEYGHAAGATAFFSRLAAEGELQNLPGMAIFASHPPSAERVRAIEQQIGQQGYSIKETAPLAQPLEEPQ
ncbi:MAG: M48 family metalloprotease, partial [Cyanobacteria bacterium J06648_10]